MTGSQKAELPRILFFNINGNGTGHLSRCLAYARRLENRAEPVFFSLASAIDVINGMGFTGDYFVSQFWSAAHVNAWECELAMRLGLMLEEVRPSVVVFDGTWPFHGFMKACEMARVPRRVWSNRGLHKPDFTPVPVAETAFDLVIRPGEIGAGFTVERSGMPGRKVTTPPVTLLRSDELLDRSAAREALGLRLEQRYALFSLGPGNLKDVGEIAQGLIDELRAHDFMLVWARAPISIRDVRLPDDVTPITAYPLVRYMRAFDVFVGAAGYNTCCEVLQAGVPSLLVPNTLVADDQSRRAAAISGHAPVVVSACETKTERADAVARLLAMPDPSGTTAVSDAFDLSGAERAADELVALIEMADCR